MTQEIAATTGGDSPLGGGRLEHYLTVNGLAFARRSAQSMRDLAEGGAAFAIVELSVAVEVLLKARLVREHWTLICANPDKATPETLMCGDVKTVTPEQAVDRLHGVLGIVIKGTGYDNHLRSIGQLRNRAVHFTLTPDGELPIGVQAGYSRALNFVLWFLQTQFRDLAEPQTTGLVSHTLHELTADLEAFEEMIAERRRTIAPALAAADFCVECPRCHQPAFMLNNGVSAECAFCLTRPEGTTAAVDYVEEVLGISRYEMFTQGGDWPICDCINCGAEAIVAGVQDCRQTDQSDVVTGVACVAGVGDVYWGCFSCGFTASRDDTDLCARCGVAATTITADAVVCSNCFDTILRE